MNNRRKLLVTIGSSALTASLFSFAQAQGKVWRIGVLSGANRRDAPFYAAFDQRLAELGYVQGKNFIREFRTAEGRYEKLPLLVAELVNAKCDVILASGPEVTIRAAHDGAGTIPVVMVAIDFDPVAAGLIKGLQRPGVNLTGVSFQAIELTAKRVELLRELLPRMRRIGVLSHATTRDQLAAVESTARAMKLEIKTIEAGNPPYDHDATFHQFKRSGVDAVFVLMAGTFFPDLPVLAEQSIKHRLPAIFGLSEYVAAGGLISYGANISDLFGLGAAYVDRILKGGKAADMPVEQPTRYVLAINLKTAKALGIKIPQSIMVHADKVIE
jgi:putative ABC transport system substrate-binding protein